MHDKAKAKEYLERFYAVRPKKFFKRLDDCEHGLFVILRMLNRATGEIVAGDIADALNMSTPRVAAALNALERKGYAVRAESQTDRRKTVVRITDEGRRAVQASEDMVLGLVEHILQSVGEADLDEFIRVSGKINAALDERAGFSDGKCKNPQ